MSSWKELKRPFREALVDAFNRNSLAVVLQYHCDRRLDRITSVSEPFEKNVDDVIAAAVRNGWLEELAEGALEANNTHSGLEKTVPAILEGVAAKGRAYYQSETQSETDSSGDFTFQEQDKKVLDAAIRSEVTVLETTRLLVLVRGQDSGGLYAISELEPEYLLQEEDVRQSQPFGLYYPVDELGNLLPTDIEIVVRSPDFDPPENSKTIEVHPFIKSEEESVPVPFMLTPQKIGELQIDVEVYQERKNIRRMVGTKPLATVSLESTSREAPVNIVSMVLDAVRVSSFAARLRALKSNSHISYAELARRSDVPSSTIANWTRGTKPRRDRWQDIIHLADSFYLTSQEADDLLIACSLPPARELYKISGYYTNENETKKILAQWIDTPGEQKPKVFLGHVMADKKIVRSLYKKLLGDHVNPWLDEFNLLPGMNWRREIAMAIRDSHVIVACLSQSAITPQGYIRKEISELLDATYHQPQGAIPLILVRLEPFDMPFRLSKYQWINLYEQEGYDRLLQAIKQRANGELNR